MLREKILDKISEISVFLSSYSEIAFLIVFLDPFLSLEVKDHCYSYE